MPAQSFNMVRANLTLVLKTMYLFENDMKNDIFPVMNVNL